MVPWTLPVWPLSGRFSGRVRAEHAIKMQPMRLPARRRWQPWPCYSQCTATTQRPFFVLDEVDAALDSAVQPT